MLLLYCLGVTPRKLKIDGVDHPKVLSYIDVLRHGKKVGKKVAIIGQYLESHKFSNFACRNWIYCTSGAGGIGFDVAEFITHDPSHAAPTVESFAREWGIDTSNNTRGELDVIHVLMNQSKF